MISKNKFVLPIILLLLIITLPLGIYGLILHNQDVFEGSNPNKLHKFNGKLYYYDNSNNLLGTYTCISNECNDVTAVMDDEYLLVEKGGSNTISKINDRVALVYENDEIKVISIKNGVHLNSLNEVKNYGDPSMPYVIVKTKEGKYSAISTVSGGFAIADNYDYVGYLNNNYTKDIFSVSIGNDYYLIGISDSADEKILSKIFTSPIYYYTSYAVILSNNEEFAIYDYNGEAIRNNINKINIVNNSIILRNNFNKVFVYNSLNDYKAFTDYDKTYDYEIIDNSVSIMANGQTIETIDLLGE